MSYIRLRQGEVIKVEWEYGEDNRYDEEDVIGLMVDTTYDFAGVALSIEEAEKLIAELTGYIEEYRANEPVPPKPSEKLGEGAVVHFGVDSDGYNYVKVGGKWYANNHDREYEYKYVNQWIDGSQMQPVILSEGVQNA